jgi:hypothetical protein
LLDGDTFKAAVAEAGRVLVDGGVYYFDVITERMVLQHFANRGWAEDNGGFSTRWESRYDRKARIAELDIRVNTGPNYVTRERVYSPEEIFAAIESAGLTVLGAFDSLTWKKAGQRSIRVDYVAMRHPPKGAEKKLSDVARRIRQALGK